MDWICSAGQFADSSSLLAPCVTPGASTFIKNLPPDSVLHHHLSNKTHYLAPGRHSISVAAIIILKNYHTDTLNKSVDDHLALSALFLHLLNSHTLGFVITAEHSTSEI